MRVRLRNPDREVVLAGPRTVAELLRELDIAPHTVLVLAGGSLVMAGHELGGDDEVEVRPVISGGAGASSCVVCRAPAVIEEPRHRSAWCPEHFVEHVRGQVRKAIDHPGSDGGRMFHYGDRLLVAVSGGKDSLALWDVLLDLGYRADGLYIGLGIGGYSSRSLALVEAFAARRGARLIVEDLARDYGFTTPQASGHAGRSACGTCGLSKRYVFNRVAVREGHDVVVTGHNLDDEAATLLGNLLRWNDPLVARQRPSLPSAGTTLVGRAKPLYRLSEREMAAYCVVRGIEYVVEECPLVAGNTGLELKAALDLIEAGAPGTKAQFLFGFLERRDAWYPGASGDDDAAADGTDRASGAASLGPCTSCGMPTTSSSKCAFCRERARLTAGREVPALPLLVAPVGPRTAP